MLAPIIRYSVYWFQTLYLYNFREVYFMKHSKLFVTSALALLLGLGVGLGAGFKLNANKTSVVAEAAAGKATKDYPMIVNWWNDVNDMYSGHKVAIHCYGGDLTTAKTIATEKVTDHMAVGILPKGTQKFKVLKVPNSVTLPCDGWPSSVAVEWGEWPFDSAKNVVTLKYYSGDQEYNDNKAILIKDRPVMFDTSSYGNWFADNATAYAVTGSVSGWYDYTVSEGWNKLTRIGTTGYAYFTPSSTIIAPQVIVTRNKANTPGWDTGKKWNQTTDMTANYGFNPLYTTMVESGKTGDNYNWGNKSATETASEYGMYFMDKITCSGSGSITSASSNWTTVKNFYNKLTADVQGEAWKASASESGNNIQQAMYRYDYIVFYKQYSGYDDFITRSTSSGKASFSITNSTPVRALNNSDVPTILITMIAVGAVITTGGYFFLRKRKAD